MPFNFSARRALVYLFFFLLLSVSALLLFLVSEQKKELIYLSSNQELLLVEQADGNLGNFGKTRSILLHGLIVNSIESVKRNKATLSLDFTRSGVQKELKFEIVGGYGLNFKDELIGSFAADTLADKLEFGDLIEISFQYIPPDSEVDNEKYKKYIQVLINEKPEKLSYLTENLLTDYGDYKFSKLEIEGRIDGVEPQFLADEVVVKNITILQRRK